MPAPPGCPTWDEMEHEPERPGYDERRRRGFGARMPERSRAKRWAGQMDYARMRTDAGLEGRARRAAAARGAYEE